MHWIDEVLQISEANRGHEGDSKALTKQCQDHSGREASHLVKKQRSIADRENGGVEEWREGTEGECEEEGFATNEVSLREKKERIAENLAFHGGLATGRRVTGR